MNGIALKFMSFGAALWLTAVASPASATVIFSEDFEAAGFLNGILLTDDTSERYVNTSYYKTNNFNGWTFVPLTLIAKDQDGQGDQGLLLNEFTGAASITVSGLTAGEKYTLTFNESGDNVPGGDYQLVVSIDGNSVLNNTRQWSSNGPGVTRTVEFTAAGASAVLLFEEGGTSGASPIIDDVQISDTVPEPATLALLGTGLLGLALRRRVKR